MSAPGDFLVTRKFAKVVVALAILMMFFFFGIVFKALRRPDNKKSKIKRHTLKLLLGMICFTAATNIWGASMIMLDRVDPKVCVDNGRFGGR